MLSFMATILSVTYVSQTSAQQAPDIIRGRITDEYGFPIKGARITLLQEPTEASRTSETDADGRFSIMFPSQGESYIMSVSALGMQPGRKILRRIANEAVILGDLIMDAYGSSLDAVNVTGRKDRRKPTPDRRTVPTAGVGSAEWVLSGNDPRVSPADAGDLSKLAERTPGMTMTPNGASALGAGTDQNSSTLNGMSFSGSKIPLGANVGATSSFSTFDPARGGFSGSQTALSMNPGSNFITRSLSFAFEAPFMQVGAPAARQLGESYTNGLVSWAGTGPLVDDRVFYNVSLQLSRRSSPLPVFGGGSETGAERLGINPDSVQRFMDLINTSGARAGYVKYPAATSITSATTLSQIDWVWPKSDRSLTLTGYGSIDRAQGVSATANSLLSTAGSRNDAQGSLQSTFTSYAGSTLNQFKLSISGSNSSVNPYVNAPLGVVSVQSLLEDGSYGLTSLYFGGDQNGGHKRKQWNVQARNETSWYTYDSKHRLQLTSDIEFSRVNATGVANQLGTYHYQSLEDLENNVPSYFNRTINGIASSSRVLNASLSLGDAWRVNHDLQIQYGLRIDGSRFSKDRGYNPLIDSLFGARTDRVPGQISVSPRFGFTWMYSGNPARERAEEYVGWPVSGIVRGGIGLFQGTPMAGFLTSMTGLTGHDGQNSQLQCVGGTVPQPDWSNIMSDPATIPSQCNGRGVVHGAPSVAVFSPGYRSPKSWRANASWSTIALDRYRIAIDAIYSRGQNQPGMIDLNLADDPRFALSEEGRRPVFVSPADIISQTGYIDSDISFINQTYSQVSLYKSDLKSIAKQITFSLGQTHTFTNSRVPFLSWLPDISYTLSSQRSQNRGFDFLSGTSGDPRSIEWSRTNFSSTHQIQLEYMRRVKGVTITFFSRTFSGMPYTPMVGGDINGDGRLNDRAFVFDPRSASDPDLAIDIQSILDNSPLHVKKCLAKQIGSIAKRNSCIGPWFHATSMNLAVNGKTLKLSNRLNLSVYLANPLVGIDQLLHGSNGMKGWGSAVYPNTVLLTPVGFDASNNEFKYSVDKRFGETRPSKSSRVSPFQITIGGSFALGPGWMEQSVSRVLKAGRGGRSGKRMTDEDIKGQYNMAPGYILATPVRIKDSLMLSSSQLKTVEELVNEFHEKVDSIWSPVATHLSGIGDDYDVKAETKKVEAAHKDVNNLYPEFGKRLKFILTIPQWEQLPEWFKLLLSNTGSASVQFH